ncbi:hypothetical protein RD110_05595 [Rhodoferax koreense]|uniref:Surface antigen domain-containing protein n=1 Tax=Rhodoferax koreensis TaxID=1842727 RepID=A0A1P8JSK1_9BURK|nr:hypothetical protein [Rhodoferax koreense]APW36729.1 hypothetical protein RD110_05595 [Rhodoferax koreense]
MRKTSLAGLAAAAAIVPAMLFFATPSANSQGPSLRANPSFQVIGASASGNASTAWFHDPSTGRAIACQTVVTAASGLTGMQCVAAKLPQETP